VIARMPGWLFGGTRPGTERLMRKLVPGIRLLVFDFDGVFTDDKVYVLQDGTEAVRCFRGDGLGLQKLKDLGLYSVIISTETNPVVSARAGKLNLPCVQGSADKLSALRAVMRSYAVCESEIAYIGNDINDLDCLRTAGLPIVVRNAHPEVIPYARYRTRAVGGAGAVREVCDLFSRALRSCAFAAPLCDPAIRR